MRFLRIIRDLLTVLGIFLPIFYIAHASRTLPASLPSHFDSTGHANAFAPKAIVWLMPVLAIALALILTVVSRFPRIFNLPAPVGDPARPRQEAIAVELLGWLRLELVWTFAYVGWSVVRVAMKQAGGLGQAFMAIAMFLIFGTIVFFISRMIRPASV